MLALKISTCIEHSPTVLDKYDKLGGKRAGDVVPPYPLDGEFHDRTDKDGKVTAQVRVTPLPEAGGLEMKTLMPKSAELPQGATLTEHLHLQDNGRLMHQTIKVEVPGKEPHLVDRVMVRQDAPISGTARWEAAQISP